MPEKAVGTRARFEATPWSKENQQRQLSFPKIAPGLVRRSTRILRVTALENITKAPSTFRRRD